MAVHYAGVPCEMDALNELAARHGLSVIEDAAQALLSTYKGRPAGALGDAAAISFHETKNLHCGEGGALLVQRRRTGVDRSLSPARQGDEPDPVPARRGRQVLVGRHRLVVRPRRAERRVPVGRSSSGRRRCSRTGVESGTRYHERFAPLEERGLLRRSDRARRTSSTTRTCTTSSSATSRSALA